MFAGSAASGFTSGLHGGVDIAAQLAALGDHQRLRNAHAAVGRAMMDPNAFGGAPMGGPQPPMPGVSSAPTPGGANPDPMMGPGPLPSDGAPPVPQPPGPTPMPAPQAAAPEASPAAPAQSDTVRDAQSTITNIAQAIKAHSPNISPEELFDATSAHIEQMKGVRNDVRDYMQQQVELAKIQTRLAASENRLTGQVYTADKSYEGRTDAASIRGDAQRDVAKTGAGARVEAAKIGGSSRVQAAGIGANARVTSAGIGADSRRDVADTNAGSRDYGSEQGYRGKVDSAVALSGGTARTPAPARPQRRGGGSSGDIPASALQYLKPNQNTTFGNGQVWTLKGGKPTRVK